MHLATHVQEILKSSIQNSRGHEIAAFLVVLPNGDQDIWLMNNRSGAVNRVVVLSSEVRRAERQIRRCGAQILAFIHSHVFHLEPSDEDWIGSSATGVPWVIVCYKEGSLQYHEIPTRRYGKATVMPGSCWDDLGADRAGTRPLQRLRR